MQSNVCIYVTNCETNLKRTFAAEFNSLFRIVCVDLFDYCLNTKYN